MPNLDLSELSVGNTPLLRLSNLEKILNWTGQLWAKCEYLNSTGSFKDRGSIVEINYAIKQNKKGVVCASTGNMAASLAAFAAKANITCLVVAPDTTPQAKLKQAQICGAEIIKIEGVYDTCVSKAQQVAQENNYLLCGDYEQRRFGQSTVGIELVQSDIKFDAFVVPVGNGTLGCAVSQGFAVYGQFPALIGVQGKSADPIFKAWQSSPSIIRIIEEPKTIASAMCVGNPLDGKLTLEWIKRTNGSMYSVTDSEIIKAQKLLAETEGIFVETAAATTIATLTQMKNKRQILVLILTGNGLKENLFKGGDLMPVEIFELGKNPEPSPEPKSVPKPSVAEPFPTLPPEYGESPGYTDPSLAPTKPVPEPDAPREKWWPE